jgi:hypothetical protein
MGSRNGAHVGLDVSLKLTAICIVDRTGKIERERVVTSDPDTIAAFVKSHAPHVARIGLEAGALQSQLFAPGDDRRPHALQEVAKCRGLCWTDNSTIRIRRDRLHGSNLKMRRQEAANLPLRGRQCAAHPHSKVLGAQSLRHQACDSGLRKAKVAVARKLAVILHRMWIEGTEFRWSSKEAANQPA